jgi:hypothetical protein|tara:strand:- start:710 stop:1150 length:441 start_codon:yes stop_codon:yes gene_type:complete
MIIVDYKPEHARDILAGEMNKGAPKHIGQFRNFADNLNTPGTAFTALDNGYLIACAGIIPLWSGVGEAWFLASERLHDYSKPIIKAVTKDFKKIIEEHEFKRVQAAVRTDWPEAQRFSRFLGFKQEGLMEKFGPDGSDYYRVARIT